MQAPFPLPGDQDYPRSVITLTQIETFLTLVEEGGVARAAQRLGVGRSTVSAHSKLVADEIGPHHFRRLQGGLVPTEAGLDAYGRLRALVAHAAFCIEHFRSGNPRTPSFVPVQLPFGFPGTVLDQALERASRRLTGVCLLPTYSKTAPTEELGFCHLPWDADTGLVPDRWLLVRYGAPRCAKKKTGGAALEELAGLRLHAPRLPAALQISLTSLAEQANAMLEWGEGGLPEILALVAQSPRSAAIVPTSLFNPALIDGLFDCAAVESTHLDPAIAVSGLEFPEIARLLKEELERALHERIAAPAARPTRAAPSDTLSLKYCRSFLALYEEGNVGRAAQRLSIVQPALTVQLHRIEEEVGCSLFGRSHHGVSANERADALYKLLRPLIANFTGTLRHLRTSTDNSTAPVRIGLMPALDDESIMSQGFAVALDRWSRSHPDGVLQVMEGYSGTLVRWLQSGMVDFALVDRVFTDPELILEPIVEDRMAVVVACGSDLVAPGPITLARLATLPLVLPSARHGLRTLLVQSLHRAGLVLQPRIEVDSMAGCINMVKIARYATILPMGSVYKSSNRRGVSVHEIEAPQIVRTICLARMRGKSGRDAETDFLAELRLAFAKPAIEPPIMAPSRDFYGPARQFT
jgi:LysR family nitrogen assimilation transcriptional regulator